VADTPEIPTTLLELTLDAKANFKDSSGSIKVKNINLLAIASYVSNSFSFTEQISTCSITAMIPFPPTWTYPAEAVPLQITYSLGTPGISFDLTSQTFLVCQSQAVVTGTYSKPMVVVTSPSGSTSTALAISSNTILSIYSGNKLDIGTYTVKVIYTASSTDFTYTFDVIIQTCVVTLTSVSSPQSYDVGSVALDLTFSYSLSGSCSSSASYKATLSGVTSALATASVDQVNQEVTVTLSTTDNKLAGTYTVGLVLSDASNLYND